MDAFSIENSTNLIEMDAFAMENSTNLIEMDAFAILVSIENAAISIKFAVITKIRWQMVLMHDSV